MSIGETLILLCASQEDMTTFLSLRETMFKDAGEQRLFTFVRSYLREYDKFPPLGVIRDSLGVSYRSPKGEPAHYAKELRALNVKLALSEGLPGIAPLLRKDPYAAVRALKELLSNLDTESESRDFRIDKDPLKRFEEYIARKRSDGISYLSTGNPFLDSIILGYGRTELITIGGRPGIGKTWLLLCLLLMLDEWCHQVYAGLAKFLSSLDFNRPILFISNEMNEDELAERIDCMMFKIPYQGLLSGKLTRREEGAYKRGLQELAEAGSRVVVIYNCDTLDELEAKILLYNPLAVFLDGSYLLEPDLDEGYAKTVKITRKLKAMCMKCGVPIINTTQLRKKGKRGAAGSFDGQDEFYYGSYIQDSDISIRAYQTPDMVFHHMVGLEIPKGRKIPPGTQFLWECDTYEMNFNFSQDEDATFFETPAPEWRVKSDPG